MRGNLSKSHSTCEVPCLCPEKLPIEVASVGKKESPFSQCVSFSLFRAVFCSLLLLLPGKMWSDKGWRDKNSKGKISFSSCLAVLSSLSQETMRENGRLVFDLRWKKMPNWRIPHWPCCPIFVAILLFASPFPEKKISALLHFPPNIADSRERRGKRAQKKGKR